MARPTFQAPTGTRDFYPADLQRRRYIEKAWRDVSIRYGFEEIDGPTFESTDLYAVKSGEGILGELFQAFSGKSQEEIEQVRASGRAPYALRPEFTPTLARMYAAKAGSLPRPTKWFWQQACYRAERPQRGRLREFMQWNADLIGDGSPAADAEAIACTVGLMEAIGLRPSDVRVKYSQRQVLGSIVSALGVDDEHAASAFILLDRRDRLSDEDLEAMAYEFGLTGGDFIAFLKRPRGPMGIEDAIAELPDEARGAAPQMIAPLRALGAELEAAGIGDWCDLDLNIARGLAYYTGMVFEIHEAGGKERAIAGGGRYDNLIELFGGPQSPAVGFGMGDVVLSLVLADRGLMPDGKDLLDALALPSTGARPDVFVLSNGVPEADAEVRPLVARLRRGRESGDWLAREGRRPWDCDRYAERPLHARHSYKATRNIGKILQEASAAHARFAAILESPAEATLKNLDTGDQERVPAGAIAERVTRAC